MNTFNYSTYSILQQVLLVSSLKYFLNLLIFHHLQCPVLIQTTPMLPRLCSCNVFLIILTVSILFCQWTLFYTAARLIMYKCKSDHTLLCSDPAVVCYSLRVQAKYDLTSMVLHNPTHAHPSNLIPYEFLVYSFHLVAVIFLLIFQ